MAKPAMATATIDQVLDALDAGRQQKTISDFLGVNLNSVNRISSFRTLVTTKDHTMVSRWVFNDQRLGQDTKKYIMKRYGYSIPEEYLPKPEKKEPAAQTAVPAPAPAPQIDYRPLLQSLMTQISTMNATLTVLRDIGTIDHNVAELLSSFCPSVSKDLDEIKERQQATDETINAIFQAIGSISDRQKVMLSYLKKG